MNFDPLEPRFSIAAYPVWACKVCVCIIKQGHSDSEVIICFGIKVISRPHTVIESCNGVGCTLRHCHKLFVMNVITSSNRICV